MNWRLIQGLTLPLPLCTLPVTLTLPIPIHLSVLPVQNWACSSHWVESGWRASGPGSIPHWLSCTWHLRSRERSPQWAPSRHSKRSFHPGQGWHGPPGSHMAVPVVVVPAPASSAPVPWSLVSAGNSGLPHTEGKSPGKWRLVQWVGKHGLNNNSSILFITTVIRGKTFTTVSVGEVQVIYKLSCLPHDPHNTQRNIRQRAAQPLITPGVARVEIHDEKRGYHLFLKHSSLDMSLSMSFYVFWLHSKLLPKKQNQEKNNRRSNSGFALWPVGLHSQ